MILTQHLAMRLTFPSKKTTILRLIQMIPCVVAIIGILSLWLWFSSGPKEDLTERIPGTDTKGLEIKPQVEVDASRGRLVKYDGLPADLPGAWPRFRGKNFDGISVEEMPLAKEWDEGEPKVLWGIDVGEGYAGDFGWTRICAGLRRRREGGRSALPLAGGWERNMALFLFDKD